VTSIGSESLEDTFRLHHAWLLRRLTLVVGDAEEARDLVQETFVRAAKHWPLPQGQGVRPWLTVVGVRLAINERRRRRLWGFFSVNESDAVWAINVDPDLWAGLMALEPRGRAALVLTVLDGYTQEEVAEALGVRRGTVASLLFRARERLRPILEDRT
jgi:RNA polymerase sigma-70 factor (ECF subfamily)